nr:hypothetical protein [Tanacetum cinerariifolium]
RYRQLGGPAWPERRHSPICLPVQRKPLCPLAAPATGRPRGRSRGHYRRPGPRPRAQHLRRKRLPRPLEARPQGPGTAAGYHGRHCGRAGFSA